ncbi:MAG: DUF1015 domain-containing protein [Thermodesulfobacterium sp.]|nr:DUF1015 domain-containing protein [Thermodesulfobacterium sp.]
MPECLPFCAWRYNPEKVKIEEVVAPPYDIVSEEEIRKFKIKSSYNIFHLELPEDYKKAKDLLESWINSEILIKDKTPGIYFYELKFSYQNKSFVRKGFILLVKLSSFEEGKIFPHERTYSKITDDRFELLKTTRFQFSQVFALYEDPFLETLKAVDKNKEFLYRIQFGDEDHRLYKISEKKLIRNLLEIFKSKKFYIADGHHRYKTALRFKEYMESIYGKSSSKDYNYISMYISPLEDENLLMLPTYRAYYFEKAEGLIKEMYRFATQKETLKINEGIELNHCFEDNSKEWGILFGEEIKIFSLKDEVFEDIKNRDSIFSEIPLYNFLWVFEKILKVKEEALKEKGKVKFISDIRELLKEVSKGALGVVFPFISSEILKKVALAQKLMPHKCTYFYPKILTGLVLNEINGNDLKYNTL